MSGPGGETGRARGALAWMAQNSVAANILMIFFVVGGLLFLPRIKQEVFPEFELDLVMVTVPYPGASPAEVEQGVVLAIEEEVRGLDGVKEVRSVAAEGMAVVTLEILLGADSDRVLADVKSAVDRVTSFPVDIERPTVSLVTNRQQVIALVVHGDTDERALRELAERAREDLLADPRITYAELAAVRPYEISVEVSQENLRAYGLTLNAIAERIRQASVELPGGGVKTSAGEVLVRTTERRQSGDEFGDIVLLSRSDGSHVRVRDLAQVRDDFADTDAEAYYNGARAAVVKVFRVGAETPTAVADAVKEYAAAQRAVLPAGVGMDTWADASEMYRDRLDLLLRNARFGLVLVILTLGLFLEVRLAFWVTTGIPVSIIGALMFLPLFGVSINMITLFAFIMTLGIVVDDAIVVGDAVYARREQGLSFLQAAIAGVRDVGTPVFFAVSTTLVAFVPIMYLPGLRGKFFFAIPIVVITVLTISLLESLFVLPAHLAHLSKEPWGWVRFLNRGQVWFGERLRTFIEQRYTPVAAHAVKARFVTAAVALALLLLVSGLLAGGHIRSVDFPRIDSDRVEAKLSMPFGSSVAETRQVERRLLAAAQQVFADIGGEAKFSRGIFSQVAGQGAAGRGGARGDRPSAGSHLAEVVVYMVPSDQRPITAREFAQRWREALGEVVGVETLEFEFTTGPGAASPIDFELSHRDLAVLEEAAADLAQSLTQFAGVIEIDDGFAQGKEQLDFRLKPAARAAGLTELEVARQVRASFFGAEAVRQQRGREEVRAYVRLPRDERRSEYDIEQLLIRAPGGQEIPLGQAVEVRRGRSYTAINRLDGRRVAHVTADVVHGQANANEVTRAVEHTVMPALLERHIGLSYAPGGQQKEQGETDAAMRTGFSLALIAMFVLLAIEFRSYLQPLIVMTAIPFGLVGALLGHLLLGHDFSMMSKMGMVALSGIVVNDSLVLIDAINEMRRSGMQPIPAVIAACQRRFRPIMLTSLTTFFGLLPMILEPSVQARFLIPMAISLGFGVMFSTLITLLLVPALYVLIEDAKGWVARLRGGSSRLSDPAVT